MHHASRILNLAASLALTTLSASPLAQTAVPFKSTCQAIGIGAQEPIGDRDGHTISVSEHSCRNEGGLLDGSIMTGVNIFEWDKGNGVVLSGNGVIRKPGAMVVYQIVELKTLLTMADGKVTGFTGTAKGIYKVATGSAASLSGKSFTSTHRSVGGGQFVIETTID